jgi:hypothetical protein
VEPWSAISEFWSRRIAPQLHMAIDGAANLAPAAPVADPAMSFLTN